MSKNRNYSKEFKFKVTVEMIKGDLTIAEIISKYEVPRSVISRWKKQFLDNGSKIFESEQHLNTDELIAKKMDKLHSVIGRLKVENDFLQIASAKLKL